MISLGSRGPVGYQGCIYRAFKFTGRGYDPETGLYSYQARYYDPATGRFIYI
jgi:RHS repeat-associated protein